jgi:pimeloyl-ACP methyl ester carboxylesterase
LSRRWTAVGNSTTTTLCALGQSIGHSFGGQVALDFTLEAPDRVRSLTMLCSRDTPFPAFGPAAVALRHSTAVDVDSAMARWFRADELAAGGWLVDYARRCLRDADRMQWATALEAIAGYDRSHVVSRIEQPVTLIAAELDQVSTPASMSALADRLPSAHLHVIPGAAHMTPLADPESLTRALIGAARR